MFSVILTIVWLYNFSIFSVVLADDPETPVDRAIIYQKWLDESMGDSDITKSDMRIDAVNEWIWWEMFNKQINTLIVFVIDAFIVIGIAVAFFGWYKIMVSDKEETMKDGMKLVIFWVLWIIIMVSARFLANSLVWDSGIIPDSEAWKDGKNLVWIELADNLYHTIMFPFIKIALYLVVWVLFFMMVAKIVTFVTSTDEAAKKKAWWLIIWTVVWILIIMWAKQVVEAIMWKQKEVIKTTAVNYVGDMWTTITDVWSIPLISQIINWVMWLTMFAVVILIIIQAYRMFAKPDDPKNRETLKKTILYVLIGVLVIWAAYVIANVLVINNIPQTAS